MIRFAAHYVVLPVNNINKLSYIELDEDKRFRYIHPLISEVEDTAFYNGVLLVVDSIAFSSSDELSLLCNRFFRETPDATLSDFLKTRHLNEVAEGTPVHVYLLEGINLLSAELRTNNGCSHCHIQRLC
jgi:hypothetical protein